MKTFEGSHIHEIRRESDDWRLVLPIYLLRAIAVTIILLLFLYIAGRILSVIDSELKFQEFIFNNVLTFAALSILLFLSQAVFYVYCIRRKLHTKRRRNELIINYILPMIGILLAIYVAYAIGAM